MKDEGWVKLHRKIWNNPWMRNPNYLIIWVWILTHAEYREEDDPEIGSYVLEGKRINLKKGELTCGTKKIAEDTGTSRSTVVRALEVFEKEEQIEQRANTKFTLIIVKKWKQYQDKRTTTETTSGQRVTQPADTYKENKNTRIKEDKNKETILIAPATASADIILVFEVFSVLAKPNYGNTTQRKAIQELIASYGLEKTLAAAKFAVSIQSEKYAPVITNPYQLKAKFGELVAFKARQDKSGSKSLVAEI